MAIPIGEGVSLRGFYSKNWALTWNLTGTTSSADIGKAMTQDTSAANTARLAGDNDSIIGILQSRENRIQEGVVVGTICMAFSEKLPYTGTIPAIGSQVVGAATLGTVKAATASLGTGLYRKPAIVVEQSAGDGTVVVLFM